MIAADHADRLAARVAEEFVLAKAGHREIDRGAFDLGRPTGAVAEEIHRRRDVDALRDDERLAVVERFDLGKFDRVGLEQIGQFEEPALAIDRACRAPFTGLECRTRRPHGEIDVGPVSRRNRGDDLAGCGIADVEPAAGEGVAPLAADQHLVRRGEEPGSRFARGGGMYGGIHRRRPWSVRIWREARPGADRLAASLDEPIMARPESPSS